MIRHSRWEIPREWNEYSLKTVFTILWQAVGHGECAALLRRNTEKTVCTCIQEDCHRKVRTITHTHDYKSLDDFVLPCLQSLISLFIFREALTKGTGWDWDRVKLSQDIFFSHFAFHSTFTWSYCICSHHIVSLIYFFSIVLMLISCHTNLILSPFPHLSPITPPESY